MGRNERTVLIDGREFVAGQRTGIGRFLEGLLHAAVEAHGDWKLVTLLLHSMRVGLPRLLSMVNQACLSRLTPQPGGLTHCALC